MRSSSPLALLVAALVVGCQPAAPPAPPAARPVVGPAEAKHDDHAGHDHAGHDHAAEGQAANGEMADEGHEGHHHPETLAELVAELETLAATVKSGLEKGVREEADAAVHQFGHLVEDVEALAKEAKLPEAVEGAAVKAGSDLFDCFDKLDQAIHGDGDVAEAWKGQAEAVDAALAALKAAVAK